MKKTVIWLIVGVVLVIFGCAIFGGVMTTLKWDFTKLSTTKYETNEYNIVEEYKNISIDTDTADIVFIPSEELDTTVTCKEQTNMKHTVSVKDNTLLINVVNTKKWYEYIGIAFESPKITVSIPQRELGKLKIKSDTGKIEIPSDFSFESINITESTGSVENYASALSDIRIVTSTGNIEIGSITAGSIDLHVSTGKITVSSVTCNEDVNLTVSTGKAYIKGATCKNFSSNGSTGAIYLTDVIAAEKLSLKRSTGDICLDSCDAGSIYINTDTGDVSGSLLREKVFIAKTDTGRIDLPKTVNGGICEISTDTGDIKIEIKRP